MNGENFYDYRNQINPIKEKFEELLERCRMFAIPKDIEMEIKVLEKMNDHHPLGKGMQLSAQMSLYPLRCVSLSEAINVALEKMGECDLTVVPGMMSTFISGDEQKIWAGLQKAFSAASAQNEVVMVVTVSNACPQPDGEGD